MEAELRSALGESRAIGHRMPKNVRGQRLLDICPDVIEVILRILYERTCDVRWLATDPAVIAVTSLAPQPISGAAGHHSVRVSAVTT